MRRTEPVRASEPIWDLATWFGLFSGDRNAQRSSNNAYPQFFDRLVCSQSWGFHQINSKLLRKLAVRAILFQYSDNGLGVSWLNVASKALR